jgi:hypothetical protein
MVLAVVGLVWWSSSRRTLGAPSSTQYPPVRYSTPVAVEETYESVADKLRPGEVVAWTSAKGFYAATLAEVATWGP